MKLNFERIHLIKCRVRLYIVYNVSYTSALGRLFNNLVTCVHTIIILNTICVYFDKPS